MPFYRHRKVFFFIQLSNSRAGPIEATAIGNALIQFRSLGYIENEKEAARLLKNSFSITEYYPQERPLWEEQYQRYQKVTALCHVRKTVL